MTYQSSKELVSAQLAGLRSTVVAMKAIGTEIGFTAHGEAKLAIASHMVDEAEEFYNSICIEAETITSEQLHSIRSKELADRLVKGAKVKWLLPTPGEIPELVKELRQAADWQRPHSQFVHDEPDMALISQEELEDDRIRLGVESMKVLTESFARQLESFYPFVCTIMVKKLIETWNAPKDESSQCCNGVQCVGGVCRIG